MSDSAPEPTECDDDPKLTAEEWAFVEALAKEDPK